MSVDFEGTNDVQRESIRAARKEHWCDACHARIKTGERYSYTFIVYDGNPSSIARCMRCEAIYQHLWSVNTAAWESGPDGELNCGHTYQEIHGREPPEEIARLAFLTGEEVAAGLTSARPRRIPAEISARVTQSQPRSQ